MTTYIWTFYGTLGVPDLVRTKTASADLTRRCRFDGDVEESAADADAEFLFERKVVVLIDGVGLLGNRFGATNRELQDDKEDPDFKNGIIYRHHFPTVLVLLNFVRLRNRVTFFTKVFFFSKLKLNLEDLQM
jgi:hypothetical protein